MAGRGRIDFDKMALACLKIIGKVDFLENSSINFGINDKRPDHD